MSQPQRPLFASKEEARLWRDRWLLVNQIEIADRRAEPPERKLRALDSLYLFARHLGKLDDMDDQARRPVLPLA